MHRVGPVLPGGIWACLILFASISSVAAGPDQQTTSTVDAVTPTGTWEGTAEATGTLTPTDPLTETPVPPYTPTETDTAAQTSTPAILPSAPPATASLSPSVSTYVDILIKVRPRKLAQLSTQFQEYGQVVDSPLSEINVIVLKVPAEQASSILEKARIQPGVLYAEPNYTAQALDVIPNDPGWANQYNLVAIRAPQGWDLSTGSSAITIAIVDSGVDMGHPDLAGKLVPGYDFVDNDSVPQDDHGHGTHVAGIAAAASNNATGMAGVSWGARIMPIKAIDSAGNATYEHVAAGIVWAADHDAQIINLSLGGAKTSQVLQDAVDYASGKGALLVAATGNTGSNNVLYPAAYDAVMAVAATDGANNWAALSSYGPAVDIAAPGVSIYSANIGGGYIYRDGTSMAAPHVAGLAAILFGLPGNASAAVVRSEIETTALDVGPAGWDIFVGAGLIQMDAAIQAVPAPPAANGLPSNGIPFPGNQVFTLTPLPTPTQTATPTQVVALASLTPSEIAPTGSAEARHLTSNTALPMPAGAGQTGSDYLLPCLGLGLILSSIAWVVWFSRDRRRHPRRYY